MITYKLQWYIFYALNLVVEDLHLVISLLVLLRVLVYNVMIKMSRI